MADITDPQAVRFVNEQVRPLCEEARALRARIDSMSTSWFGGINLLIPNTQDMLDDGREEEGVSRLTGGEINQAVEQLFGIQPNGEIIAKPCVRPLTVT